MAILLLHDWEIVRKAIDGDVSVLSDIPGALTFARTGEFEVALVDVGKYGAAVRGLSRYLPVIGLSSTPTNPQSNLALLNGALTVIPLECKIRELREVVKKAKEGSLAKENGEEVVVLSPRQEDVLGGVVSGMNAPQIAERLGLSVGYVRNVIRVLYEKTGADKGEKFTARARLVRWAMENGYGGD